MQAGFAPVKVASCLAAILALGVTSAGGAVQGVEVPGGFRVETYDARGSLLVAEHGRGVIYRITKP